MKVEKTAHQRTVHDCSFSFKLLGLLAAVKKYKISKIKPEKNQA